MSILSIYKYTVCSTHKSQKEAADPLELDLGTIASYCVSAGNQAWVLSKSSKGSYVPNYVSSPKKKQKFLSVKGSNLANSAVDAGTLEIFQQTGVPGRVSTRGNIQGLLPGSSSQTPG